MVGGLVTNLHGLSVKILNIDEGGASATYIGEGNEGYVWEFDDEYDPPVPIPLTTEILEKNGWYLDPLLKDPLLEGEPKTLWLYKNDKITLSLNFPIKQLNFVGVLGIFTEHTIRTLSGFLWKDTLYVHELQHALRLCGLDELADNFKI